MVGTIQRTAWTDDELFDHPIATDVNGAVFNQEVGLDGAGAAIPAWVTASPMELDSGEVSLDIFGFLPDFMRQAGTPSLTVLTRAHPDDVPTANGPFTIDATGHLVDMRVDGKMAGYKIESNEVGGDFRLGLFHVEVQSGGSRRPP